MLREAMKRVYTYLKPGGLFLFDVNTRSKLERIDGQSFVREDEDVFCVWQCMLEENLCQYHFDIFELNEDGAWNRYEEHHIERVYDNAELTDMLQQAGFTDIELRSELVGRAAEGEGRTYFLLGKKTGINHEETIKYE